MDKFHTFDVREGGFCGTAELPGDARSRVDEVNLAQLLRRRRLHREILHRVNDDHRGQLQRKAVNPGADRRQRDAGISASVRLLENVEDGLVQEVLLRSVP